MVKKLIKIAVVTIMLFVVFGLTACDNVSLADYKVTKSKELQDFADAKGEEKYSVNGWTVICKAVTDGKIAIENAEKKSMVDISFVTAENEINAVLSMEDELQDFVLRISVDNNIKNRGEDFVVEISLKNQSGEDVEIAFGYTHPSAQSFSAAIPLFWSQIEGWSYAEMPGDIEPGEANFATITNNGFYRSECEIGSAGFNANFDMLPLSKGTHELKFRAIFSLDWGTDSQHEFEVWSNTLRLIVK